MADDLGRAVLELRTDGRKLDKGVDRAGRKAKGLEKTFKGVSRGISGALAGVSFAAVIAGLEKMRDLAIEQSRAEAQVAAGIRSTGNAAGFTAEQLERQASALQQVTRFGDEQILRAQSRLLTFSNISGKVFTETTKLTLDLATAMESDLNTAALQLGKLLNAPIENFGAASRAGVQFSKSQKELVKDLWETGRVAEAQTIILRELNDQVGGRAQADVEAYGGKWQQLTNQLSDDAEKAGGAWSRFLDAFAAGILEADKNLAIAEGRYKDLSKALEVGVAPAFKEVSVTGTLAADAMDEASESLFTSEKAAEVSAKAARAAADDWAELLKQFERVPLIGLEVESALDRMLQSQRDRLAPGIVDIDALEDGVREVAIAFGEESGERVQLGLLNAVEQTETPMQDMAAAAGLMFAREALNALDDGFEGLFASIGALLGSALTDQFSDQIGNSIGNAIGGAAGGVLNAMAPGIGSLLGAVAGQMLGKFLDDLFSSAPDVGTATFGPGGTSVAGGVAMSGLSEALAHINELLRQINDITGGGIELTQQIALNIDETGKVWVDILDLQGQIIGSLGSFDNLADASEAALVQLLNTASLSEEMEAAFRDLISSATDINKLFEDLRFIDKLDVNLNRLGGAGRQAGQAIRDALRPFNEMRSTIEGMGLSAEATALALAKVDKAQKQYELTLKTQVFGSLAALAEELGVQTRLITRARVLETRIRFLVLRAQLVALGLWERFSGLFFRLRELAFQAARGKTPEGEEGSFAGGSGRFLNFAPVSQGGSLIRAHDREQIVTAGEGQSLASMVFSAMRNAHDNPSGSAPVVAAIDGLRAEMQEQRTLIPMLVRDAALKVV